MLATETDRLNYLAALGVTQYRARVPLPGAAASVHYAHKNLAEFIAEQTASHSAATVLALESAQTEPAPAAPTTAALAPAHTPVTVLPCSRP